MRKLVFLSGEDLLDVDMPIVKEINSSYHKQFNITWIIVLRGYGWFKNDEVISFCIDNNIKYIIKEQIGKLKNPLNILFHIKLLKTIKEIDPDIIYDSYLGVPFMHFLRGVFLKKKPFVIAIHDVVQHYKRDNKFVRTFYDVFLINIYSNFHIFSRFQLKIFNDKYKGKNSFYSPLFLKNFGKVNTIQKVKNENTTNFLFFGIIRPNKGLDLLINAANSLGEKNNNFNIVIAGKCDDWEQYYALIKRPELFTFKIRNIEKSEVPNLFANTHFVILPYRDVTQSGVLLTAYNYGIPVIASRFDWFQEYIDNNTNGFLFENENVEDLINVMEIAINLNSVEYQRVVENLNEFISKEINIETIAKKYVDFFTKL